MNRLAAYPEFDEACGLASISRENKTSAKPEGEYIVYIDDTLDYEPQKTVSGVKMLSYNSLFKHFDERLYSIVLTGELSKSQFINFVITNILFGISLTCFILSLTLTEFALIMPWSFWLIPTVGSFGISLGLILNFKDSGVFKK